MASTGVNAVTDIERLLAIEDIKRVKAKYFYGLDYRDWDLWRREVWAPTGELTVPEASIKKVGLEDVISYVSKSTGDQVSIHHGHMPIIEITSDSTATAIWAMEDRLHRSKEYPLEDGSTLLHGFGHYHETYVRLAVGWRIASSRLTRLRVELTRTF
jgi:hypothetical protein